MVQAQGSRPATPHQILQLDPAAPRSLVVEAYLLLSRRAANLGETSWLQELRTAYSAAMKADVADGVQSDHPRDYYAVLRVDAAADQEVIKLAHAMLPGLEPAPPGSMARYLREEAFRTLYNAQLRARYDRELREVTLAAPPRPELRNIRPSREEPRQERQTVERKKRGLFGRGQERDLDAARDARLLSLRSLISIDPDEPDPEEAAGAPSGERAAAQGEVIFTSGPREGMRVEVDGNVIPLGDGKSTGTLWRQGERFMLRHSGKGVRVGGTTPSLQILVLEDGDEIAIGSDRAVFQILKLSPRDEGTPVFRDPS